jgi:hypothetical protein
VLCYHVAGWKDGGGFTRASGRTCCVSHQSVPSRLLCTRICSMPSVLNEAALKALVCSAFVLRARNVHSSVNEGC